MVRGKTNTNYNMLIEVTQEFSSHGLRAVEVRRELLVDSSRLALRVRCFWVCFFFGENLSRKKGDGFMNRPVTSALTKTQRGRFPKAKFLLSRGGV